LRELGENRIAEIDRVVHSFLTESEIAEGDFDRGTQTQAQGPPRRGNRCAPA
jgi:hypothetical protein